MIRAKYGQFKSYRKVDCSMVYVGEVCAGNPQDPTDGELCTSKYERLCIEKGENENSPGTLPASNGGGGGGGGGRSITVMDFNDNIDETELLDCMGEVLDTLKY